MAFFSAPGIERLYSGVTNSTASAPRSASRNVVHAAGGVPASSRSWLYSGSSPSSTNSHCSDGGSTAAMAWAYLRVSDSLRRLPTRTATFLVIEPPVWWV